jgi:hypothetical protein
MPARSNRNSTQRSRAAQGKVLAKNICQKCYGSGPALAPSGTAHDLPETVLLQNEFDQLLQQHLEGEHGQGKRRERQREQDQEPDHDVSAERQ